MKVYIFISSYFTAFVGVSLSQSVDRPRGVPLSHSILYDAKSDFTCLDGLNSIPFSQVNDDYCDCNDGSDEPGTSACPNGTFYCTNAGFKPNIIPSSRVNDGICDCCDTSDEWNSAGLCQNNCKELYKRAHEELLQQAQQANEGFMIRQQYASDGQKVKTENQKNLEQLKQSLEIARAEVLELELQKEEAEKAEKEAKQEEQTKWEEFKAQVAAREDLKDAVEAFVSLDIDRDAIVTVNEILPHSELNPNGEAEFNEESAKELLGGSSVEASVFLEEIWPKISSAFVYIDAETAEQTTTSEENLAPEEHLEDEDMEDEDYEDELAEDEEQEEEEEEEWDESGHHHTVHKHEKDKQDEPEETKQEDTPSELSTPPPARSVDLPSDPPYTPVTKILIRAAGDLRNKHRDADNKKKELENQISSLENELTMDFGPDEAFHALKGQCFELKTIEYIYKLCPFDKTVQVPIKGGSETSLGKWEGWSGPDDNKYASMKYTRGLKCWNGPDRSTFVNLSCGSENSVLSASEPSRCEYKFEFTTPAVCKQIVLPKVPSHEEL